jgi:putative nucleotidyltransferase with HDIG domain
VAASDPPAGDDAARHDVPGRGNATARGDAADRLAAVVPDPALTIIDELHAAGHAAFIVGGSLRDALLGRTPADWDMATDARPDRLVALFPGAVYENRFGTVAVRRDRDVFEITTFRTEHDYADFRRPHRVEFGDEIGEDLARRDFTVNAMAWGRAASDDDGDDARPNSLLDPFDGLADLVPGRLRAVGDPDARFREDALRMVRAVRLAATLDFEIEPATLAAIARNAALVGHLSGERVGAELGKLLGALRPSVGLRLAQETGLLAVISPELAAQRGIAQDKIPGEDLWDHTLRSVDAAPADRPVVRLAALVHDIGKPSTLADGRFHQHDVVGARLAEDLLRRLRYPRTAAEEVTHLVRHHMFPVDPDATDAAIRRFIKRIGKAQLDALFALRRADDIGSGMAPDDPDHMAFRARIDRELAAEAALDRYALAIDGTDLMRELDLVPGPRLGWIIDGLVDAVIADPVLNERGSLLLLAQGMLADMDADTGAE